ncbi:MAG: DUF1704 domain-containing protein [Candidatus Gracilibacteria bacterium]|nr:DUF1704 domain-containing protein [Candidatus Gracilibacteria bacterium]
MFKYFLKKISRNNVFLIKPFKKTNILQNPVIFGYTKITDLNAYRFIYIGKLYKQKLQLKKILTRIEKNKIKLQHLHYKILIKEIKFIYKKIDFLKNVYDFEANKIDPNYKVTFPELNYDYYNKKFFGLTKKDISKNIEIVPIEKSELFIYKSKLIELLEFTVAHVEGFKYKFGTFVLMSHSAGILNIPNKKSYSLREIITLFFHEMTHFFRRYNNLRNYGTSYGFLDYMKIDEGFSLYNEYYYGKKLMKGLKYNPYYEACFEVLLNIKLTEEEKKEKIYEILKIKGFDKDKSLYYYYRFHRYSAFGSNQFFLKDLIYTKGYKSVKKLLKTDPLYYDIIFSGKIGMSFIKKQIYDCSNNYDVKSYFDDILLEIKDKFNIKNIKK